MWAWTGGTFRTFLVVAHRFLRLFRVVRRVGIRRGPRPLPRVVAFLAFFFAGIDHSLRHQDPIRSETTRPLRVRDWVR